MGSMEESRISLLAEEDDCKEGIGLNNSALKQQAGGWKASYFILIMELFLSMALLGISKNLVVYLKTELLEDNIAAASLVSTWLGTCFLSTLIGAYVSDSYWGNFITIIGFGSICLIGTVTLTLSASLAMLKHSSFFTFLGLYLISVGSGSTKPCLSTFGADQFDNTETGGKTSFFSWYYMSIRIADFVASTAVVWIQDNYGWTIGFILPTFLVAIALTGFMAGSRYYRYRKPRGSPFTRLCQVIVAASRKKHLKLPEDTSLLYQAIEKSVIVQDNQELNHTPGFSFLDKAAIVTTSDFCSGSINPWNLCTMSQVEELKSILRLLPIWTTFILFSAVVCQESVFVEQGMVMDRRIGSVTIPAASLSSFNVLAVLISVPVSDKIIGPIVSRFTKREGGTRMTPLQRAGIGLLFSTSAISSAAVIEAKRLQIARDEGLVHEKKVAVPMSIFWQIPQYVFVGIAEAFNQIGLLEFFYNQAPDSLRSLCLALALLSLSLGSYLNSFILTVVSRVTRWIPDNLNEGHLDHFFWLVAGISLFNLVVFAYCSSRYRYKRT